MKLPWIAAASLALIGCAVSEPTTDASQTELVATAGDSVTVDTTNVREVSVESFAGLATCRRYVATGTRIAGERCESRVASESDRLRYEQTKQDLESMRRTQMYQEQARQQAMAEAARRRAGGP